VGGRWPLFVLVGSSSRSTDSAVRVNGELVAAGRRAVPADAGPWVHPHDVGDPFTVEAGERMGRAGAEGRRRTWGGA
jgi:hypothetical protein